VLSLSLSLGSRNKKSDLGGLSQILDPKLLILVSSIYHVSHSNFYSYHVSVLFQIDPIWRRNIVVLRLKHLLKMMLRSRKWLP
jgi:hypothetical protein